MWTVGGDSTYIPGPVLHTTLNELDVPLTAAQIISEQQATETSYTSCNAYILIKLGIWCTRISVVVPVC